MPIPRAVAFAAPLLAAFVAVFAQPAPDPAIVHLRPWVLDRFSECAGRLWSRQVLVSDEVPRLKDAEACPRALNELDAILARNGLKAVPAGDWMFVYPSVWHTRTQLPREIFANPTWTAPVVDLRVGDAMLEGARRIGADELNRIAAVMRRVARPPIIADAPVGMERGKPRDTIGLQILVDVFNSRASKNESVVAMYASGRLARLIYGELRDGRYVPLWDSPLFSASDLSYHDFDGDGMPEIALRGRLGQDGWLFTAFNLRGDEITRQPACETWFHYMGTRGSYTGGGFVCPITGHRDGDIEFVEGANGTTDLVGNVWSVTPKGARRGPVRFRLIKGRYVRDPATPPALD